VYINAEVANSSLPF